MRLLTIRMEDFGSYGATTVDLTDIESAMLTGPNGAGKSTMIAAFMFAVWGEFEGDLDEVVRTGQQRALVEVTFRNAGNVYRVERTRSLGTRGQSTLRLDLWADGAWKSQDGANLKDTQAAVERAVGMSAELAKATCFSLQGDSGAFAGAQDAERLRILTRLLGLERFATYREGARRKAREIAVKADVLRQDIDRMAAAGSPELIGSLEADSAAAQESLEREKGLLEAAEKDRAAAHDRKAQATAMVASSAALRRRASDAQEAYHRALAAEDRAVRERNAAEAAVERHRAALASLPSQAAEDWARQQAQEAAGVLSSAMEDEGRARAAHVAAKGALDAARTSLVREVEAVKQARGQAVREAQAAVASAEAALRDKGALLDNARGLAARLATVPCGGAGEFAACPLIAVAVQARADFAPLESEVTAATAALEDAKAARERATVAWSAPVQEPAELVLAVSEAEESERAAAAALDSTAAGVAQARERATTMRALEDRTATGRREAQEQERQLHGAEQEVQRLATTLPELAATTETMRQAMVEAEAATAGAPDDDAARRELEQAQAAVQQTEALVRGCADECARYRSRVEQHKRDLEAARAVAASVQAKRAEAADLLNQQADLLTMVAAYHDVPHLIIESVVPQIEAKANELLALISSSGIRVTLQTRAALKSSEKVVDTLRIVVRDTAGSRSYKRFSGGERFRVDWALRVALASVLSARAGVPLETLVVDEGFGSLDDEGIAAFASVLSVTARLFGLCIVITHVPALADAAPTRLRAVKGPGGSRLVVE